MREDEQETKIVLLLILAAAIIYLLKAIDNEAITIGTLMVILFIIYMRVKEDGKKRTTRNTRNKLLRTHDRTHDAHRSNRNNDMDKNSMDGNTTTRNNTRIHIPNTSQSKKENERRGNK